MDESQTMEPVFHYMAATGINLSNNSNNWSMFQNNASSGGQPQCSRYWSSDSLLGFSLMLYIFPFILILGTVGNLLAIVVLTRRAMWTMSVSFYLCAMGITDTLVLYVSGLKTWIRILTCFEMLHVSNAFCKMFKYLFYTSTHYSAWLVVALTTERMIAIWFPFRASTWCCFRRARIVTLVIGFLVLSLNLNLFWTAELQVTNGHPRCAAYHYDFFLCKIFVKINMMIYSVIPFLLVLTFNVSILVGLFKNARAWNKQGIDKKNFEICQPQQKMTITLLTISMLWFILTIPYALTDNNVIGHIIDTQNKFLLRIICYLLMYFNHAINFYVYCLTGKKFRHQLMKVFCKRRYKTQQKSYPTRRTVQKTTKSSTPLMINTTTKEIENKI